MIGFLLVLSSGLRSKKSECEVGGSDNVVVIMKKKGTACVEAFKEGSVTDITITETDTPADIEAKITVNVDEAITTVVETATNTIESVLITAIDNFLEGNEPENKDEEQIFKELTKQDLPEDDLTEIKDRITTSRTTEETTPIDVAVNVVVENELKNVIAEGTTTEDIAPEYEGSVVTTIIQELENKEIDTKYYNEAWGILNERDWEIQLERALNFIIDGSLITLKETYAREVEEERKGEGKKEKKETELEEEIETKIKCLEKEELEDLHTEIETSYVEEETHFEEGLRIRLEKILIKIINGESEDEDSDFEKVLRKLVKEKFEEVVFKMRLTEIDFTKIRVIIEKGTYYKKSANLKILQDAMGDWWYNILKVPTVTITEPEVTVSIEGDKVVSEEGAVPEEEETAEVEQEESKSLLEVITSNIIDIYTTVNEAKESGVVEPEVEAEVTFQTNEEKAFEIPDLFDINAEGNIDIGGIEIDISTEGGIETAESTEYEEEGGEGSDWTFTKGGKGGWGWGKHGKGGEWGMHKQWKMTGKHGEHKGQGKHGWGWGGWGWGKGGQRWKEGEGKGWKMNGGQGGWKMQGGKGEWKMEGGHGEHGGQGGWKMHGGQGGKGEWKIQGGQGGQGGWKMQGGKGEWKMSGGQGGWKMEGGQGAKGEWKVHTDNGLHKGWNKEVKIGGGEWGVDFNIQGGDQNGGYATKTVTTHTEKKKFRVNPDGTRTEISSESFDNEYDGGEVADFDFGMGGDSSYTITKKISTPVVKKTVTTKTVKKVSSSDK